MNKIAPCIAALSATVSACTSGDEHALDLDRLWTHHHTTPGQRSEIPAFDARTNTLWIAGVVGVDVLDAETGTLVEHIDVSAHGAVNSVAVYDGLAAFAVEATDDRRNHGNVLFYDTTTRTPASGGSEVEVGSLPDMLTFSRDGRRLLVANEGTPNRLADMPYEAGPDVDPAGTVSIIDVASRTLLSNAGLESASTGGSYLRTNAIAGMDYEPEYLAVDANGAFAWVTLQEANAIGVLDLARNEFTGIIGLGAKDFSEPGNEIDPPGNGTIEFTAVPARGLYMPDAIGWYEWRGSGYLVTANEGEFREDEVDRVTAGSLQAPAPLATLPVLTPDSAPGALIASGARSLSIRDTRGNLIYDSGDILDKAAAAAGVYDEAPDNGQGVEPEGLTLIGIGEKTFAFVGLENTIESAVGAFDITAPDQTTFIGLIVSRGDTSPEGLVAYRYDGGYFLAIAHEGSNTTTLYRIGAEQ